MPEDLALSPVQVYHGHSAKNQDRREYRGKSDRLPQDGPAKQHRYDRIHVRVGSHFRDRRYAKEPDERSKRHQRAEDDKEEPCEECFGGDLRGAEAASSPVSTATSTQSVPPAIISMLVAMKGDFGRPAVFEMTEPQAQDAAATMSTTAPSRSTLLLTTLRKHQQTHTEGAQQQTCDHVEAWA